MSDSSVWTQWFERLRAFEGVQHVLLFSIPQRSVIVKTDNFPCDPLTILAVATKSDEQQSVVVGSQKYILLSAAREDAFWKWKGIGGGSEAHSLLACKTQSCLLILSTYGRPSKEGDMQLLVAAATEFHESCRDY